MSGWISFTEKAKEAILVAQQAAEGRQHNYVDTEHVLFGALADQHGSAGKALRMVDRDPDAIRRGVEERLSPGPGRLGKDMELSPAAKVAIDLAFSEAAQLRDQGLGTEHLLLGLLAQGEDRMAILARVLRRTKPRAGIAYQVLVEHGVHMDPLRSAIKSLREQTKLLRAADALGETDVLLRPGSTPVEHSSLNLLRTSSDESDTT
jgi:ATP-dependent Clp protease ATP-binding subunit ClpA